MFIGYLTRSAVHTSPLERLLTTTGNLHINCDTDGTYARRWDEGRARSSGQIYFSMKSIFFLSFSAKRLCVACCLARITPANIDEWNDRINGILNSESKNIFRIEEELLSNTLRIQLSRVSQRSWIGLLKQEPGGEACIILTRQHPCLISRGGKDKNSFQRRNIRYRSCDKYITPFQKIYLHYPETREIY